MLHPRSRDAPPFGASSGVVTNCDGDAGVAEQQPNPHMAAAIASLRPAFSPLSGRFRHSRYRRWPKQRELPECRVRATEA